VLALQGVTATRTDPSWNRPVTTSTASLELSVVYRCPSRSVAQAVSS
jgi:hypothetical protein